MATYDKSGSGYDKAEESWIRALHHLAGHYRIQPSTMALIWLERAKIRRMLEEPYATAFAMKVIKTESQRAHNQQEEPATADR